MQVSRILVRCCAPLLLIAAACQQTDAAPRAGRPPKAPPPLRAAGYTILEPLTYKNLTIFLIEGDQQASKVKLLSLQEAMDQRKVVVHETGDVNELQVENLSDSEEVYIQSGDIIKGGQQDRVFQTDLVIPAKSGKIPVPAFCVEQGRWSKRQNEAVDRFSSSDQALASKELKLAAKHDKTQQAVWSKVEAAQEKLGGAVGAQVRSSQSASSLQLTLENDKVSAAVDEYVRHFRPLIGGKSRTTGFAFAINGRLNSADIYSSHELFAKLWPKLLKASATEAVSEKSSSVSEVADPHSVARLLEEMAGTTEAEEASTGGTRLMKRETAKSVAFESRPRDDRSRWIHKNYIVK